MTLNEIDCPFNSARLFFGIAYQSVDDGIFIVLMLYVYSVIFDVKKKFARITFMLANLIF